MEIFILRILFICPDFFDYDVTITNKLRERGHFVVYQNEVPCGSQKRYYLLNKLGSKVRWLLWYRYERKIVQLIKRLSIDTVFVIRGAQIPENILRNLSINLHLKIIQYQWDSIKNNPNSIILAKYAKLSFTFDIEDTYSYPQFQYLPLFYDWSDVLLVKNTPSYDITFICSWSESRLMILNELTSLCDRYNLSFFPYIYMPFQTCLTLLCKGRNLPLKYIHFTSLSRDLYYSLLSKSKITIDVPKIDIPFEGSLNIGSLTLPKISIPFPAVTIPSLCGDNGKTIQDLIADGKNIYNKTLLNYYLI